MKAAFATASRILRQLAGDPRTLALIFIAPLFVVFLLHAVVEAGELSPRVAVVLPQGGARADGAGFVAILKKNATVVEGLDKAAAAASLGSGKVDAVVDLGPTPPEITADAADPATSGPALKAIQSAYADEAKARLSLFAGPLLEASTPKVSFINGSESTTTFDFLAPVLLGFIVFFFTFILSGIAFLRERTSGTLERAFASPIGRADLVGGYMIGFGLVAALQTALVQLFVVGVYHAPNAAGFGPALIVSVSVALSALAMGLFLSAFANSEFQMLQFIPVVIVPQILFAGIFNLRSGPAWVRVLSYFFPLTYAGDALRDLMIRGRSLVSVLPDLAAVWGFCALFLALAVIGLGRVRRGA
jgi:ABC-2 type transport system permease protein